MGTGLLRSIGRTIGLAGVGRLILVVLGPGVTILNGVVFNGVLLDDEVLFGVILIGVNGLAGVRLTEVVLFGT